MVGREGYQNASKPGGLFKPCYAYNMYLVVGYVYQAMYQQYLPQGGIVLLFSAHGGSCCKLPSKSLRTRSAAAAAGGGGVWLQVLRALCCCSAPMMVAGQCTSSLPTIISRTHWSHS
jgi:hypothetical protein